MIFLNDQKIGMQLSVRLLTLLLCLPMHFYNHATTYEELSQIEVVCEKSSRQCLLSLESALISTATKSRPWYRLKLLQLEALFTLQQFDKLTNEIDPLLTYDALPVSFSVYVYLYHAKLSYGRGEVTTAKVYLNKAVNLLTEINEKSPKPMRLIEIANLQISMRDFELANTTLLKLELKFKNRYHPIFKRELYANLGHVAYFRDNKELHLEYREKSLNWALKTNNNQQIGIAHNNFAWAYQDIGNYKFAEQHYSQAVKYAEMEQDEINGSISQLRLIEVVLLQEKFDKALTLFNLLPTRAAGNNDSERHNELYRKLKLRLKDNQKN